MQQVKNTKAARTAGQLSHLFETILASQGGYLADQLYAFKRNEKHGNTEPEPFKLQPFEDGVSLKLRWLVLSREHYFETSKEYPIANKRDLKQALRFDDNKAPFKGITLQHIERLDEQSHRVTFWVVNNNIFDKLASKPWLLLPESYLLTQALNNNIKLATIECINKTLYVAKTGQGIFSGIQSAQTPDLEHFAFSTGSPISTDSSKHYAANKQHFVSLLSTGIKSLNLASLQGFLVNQQNINWKSYPWGKAALITAGVFSVYIALSSVWLVYKEQQLTQQLSDKKTQISQALTLQKTYQKQLEWQELLAEPEINIFPYWNTWPIVLEAISVGATFKAIHYKDTKIIMYGTVDETVKATDVLAKLSKNINVVSASFSQPVRKYRGKEEFVISFSFAQILPKQTAELTTNQIAE